MMRMRALLACAVLCGATPIAAPLLAQQTPADTAAVLVDVVRQLQAEQEWDTAEDLLRYIVRHYAGTPAAQEAQRLLEELRGIRTATSGRTNFIVAQTLFGLWLGVAIPLAFDEEPSETAFGLGLLLGGPTGFLWSSAYSRKNSMSKGQASTVNFAEWWGTWQFIGWQQVLEIGGADYCDEFGCYGESQTAPFAAGVIGGLTGLGTGLFLTRRSEIPEGDAELVNHAALWGTWYGIAFGVLVDAEDDALLTAALLGGDIALAAAIPAALAWRPVASRVRLTSIAGLAGGVGGLGLDLLFSVDDEKTGILIPTITSTVGLIAGYVLTRPKPGAEQEASTGSLTGALVNIQDGVRLDVPLPVPTPVPYEAPDGRREWRPGIKVTLLDARF